ncbi:MAG: tetratricopeptide repeat protein [Candidatus Delongbacteria bacterium]|jgi:tetratricopeptide (TPR) repeat protein|nr:tetratricopeptide repeat protein [Candidatus Delongbacteria bacterium]
MKINFRYIFRSLAVMTLFFVITILSAQSMKRGYKIDSHDDILDIVTGEEKVNMLLQKSMFEMNKNNDQQKGIKYLLQARDLSKKINYEDGIISSHNTLGDLYRSSGNYTEAINYYLEAATITKNSDRLITLSSIYMNIGYTYKAMKKFDKSIEYGNLALVSAKKLNKKGAEANANYNLAMAYRGKFEYEKALEYNEKALKLYEESENYFGLGRCYNAIGDLNEMSGNYEIAFEAYQKAEKLFKEYNSPGNLSVIYFNLASMSKVFGNYDEALMYLKTSLKISLKIKSERMIKDCYFGLYGLYNLLKDFDKANQYYMLFHSYTAETSTLNSSLAKIEIDYELSKKEMQTNLQLQRERAKRYFYVGSLIFVLALMYFLTYRQLKQRRINELRLEKRRVRAELSSLESKINPHFFFNSLSSISTLISINPDNAKKMLQNISGLFRYALRTSKNQFVTLDEEISIAKKYLELEKIRFGKRLEFELVIPNMLYSVKLPPLLIQPLVENSIKHGIADNIEGGKIYIICEEISKDTIEIRVKDNGKGVSTNGNGTGFGLTSIQERLELMFKKDYLFEINKENGYEVRIQIPKIV